MLTRPVAQTVCGLGERAPRDHWARCALGIPFHPGAQAELFAPPSGICRTQVGWLPRMPEVTSGAYAAQCRRLGSAKDGR